MRTIPCYPRGSTSEMFDKCYAEHMVEEKECRHLLYEYLKSKRISVSIPEKEYTLLMLIKELK